MATVIKRFKCKLTKKIYAPGMAYEADQERIAFLQDAGYLEGTPQPVSVKIEPVSISVEALAVANRNELELMTKKELEKELKKRNLSYNKRMTKAEYIDLLV